MTTKRTFNIIERAIREGGMEFDENDRLIDILQAAEEYLRRYCKYDYTDICDTYRRYTHIYWSDGKGFEYEADGQFIDHHDIRKNTFYRYAGGVWWPIASADVEEGDYVYMDDVFDTEGKLVRLVAKW